MKKTFTFWLVGLPSSGKTTLAESICKLYNLVHLDSDEARKYLTPSPVYSQEEREMVYRSFIYASKLLNDEGHNVIVSATANLKKYRDTARNIISNYKEIYVECPIEVCEKRDVKGLYKKSKNREINTVPMKIAGINDQYVLDNYGEVDIFELPTKSDLIINTEQLDKNDSVYKLFEFIKGEVKHDC